MLMNMLLSFALCGALFYIFKQTRQIKELKRYRIIKLLSEYTSQNMNIMKAMQDVNTVLLRELHEHLSDSTLFLSAGEGKLTVLDSTIDNEKFERELRDISSYSHPEGADFAPAFNDGAIRCIEEKNGLALIYPTAEQRGIESAVLTPLITNGEVIGYWLIEHRSRLVDMLDLKEIAALGRHLGLVLSSGLNTYYDPLMQIAKRQFVIERIEDLTRKKKDCCVVFADIDHFKSVNDRYGHDIGDEVLKLIAQVLKSSIRDKDIVGRYGGEEILLCMPEISMEQAVHRLNEIRTDIDRMVLHIDDGPPLSVTCSFGVAFSGEMAAPSADGLIKIADNRVYKAKKGGRNQVVYA